MIQLNNKNYTCPVDVTLTLIGGKWKILILSHLNQFGDRSFSQIRDNLPGVSEKMLTQQLKEIPEIIMWGMDSLQAYNPKGNFPIIQYNLRINMEAVFTVVFFIKEARSVQASGQG